MKKVELISTPNDQLEEEMISKSKKEEKNPPFKCSPFCSLKKRKKSILKSCIPHMFSVSVKVRSVSVQTSSQCLKCPPCLKEMLENSKETNDLNDISPKTSIDKLQASFDDGKSIASSKKEIDSKSNEPEIKFEEFSEKSSVVDFSPDSNEAEEKEYIADEFEAQISDTNLSITRTLQSRDVSEVSLCEDCPPCSKRALKLMEKPSGESVSISTQTSASLLSNKEYNNVPYNVQTPQDDLGDKMSRKSKSSRRGSNVSVQINDDISAKSKPSETESNISRQMDDEMSRKSKPTESHTSMQLKDIDIKKTICRRSMTGELVHHMLVLQMFYRNLLTNLIISRLQRKMKQGKQ
ncbi:hypothetical protein WA026_010996 [Henosepilachna vigintioctopunctata]|uniref:Uncharacterized protein n=1 Tax=Henosepilachna vigintioctopunctata TaxID=420089 RepID=A0AAW1URR3_9CUCU